MSFWGIWSEVYGLFYHNKDFYPNFLSGRNWSFSTAIYGIFPIKYFDQKYLKWQNWSFSTEIYGLFNQG